MKKKLNLFKENEFQTKEEVLFSMRSMYEEYVDDNIMSPYMKKLFFDFIRQIESLKIPKCDDWWFYTYEVTTFGMVLNMCHCEDMIFEDDSWELTIDQTLKISEISCNMLTVSEFAKMHDVKPVTVRQWIRRGKLRAIRKQGSDWLIASIAEKPSSKYKSVIYQWDNIDREIYEKFYFLKGAKMLHISQNKANKSFYDVVVGNSLQLKLTSSEREKLELCLLAINDIKIDENTIFISDGRNKMIPFQNIKEEKSVVNFSYGPVMVTSGEYKGRIGIYDDDDFDKSGQSLAIVFFGDVLLTKGYNLIPFQYLTDTITISDIINRINTLRNEIIQNEYDVMYKNECLNELFLCSNLLEEKHKESMKNINIKRDHKIFISHASKDLCIARALATDFINDGFSVFLDDWSIDVGENIISRISDGIASSHSLILLVSKDYLESAYCNDEWTAFYMRYSKIYKNSIYPVMIKDANPPALLSAIKYTRIKDEYEYDYKDAYVQIVKSIKKRIEAAEKIGKKI